MKIIVCGLGQVGFRVSMLLLRLGETVTVVAAVAREPFADELRRAGAQIIVGDARIESHLMEAGILEADVVLACTDHDLVNIEIALDSIRIAPQARVVLRLFDRTLASRLQQNLGIQRAVGMSIIAAPIFAAAAVDQKLVGEFFAHDRLFHVSFANSPQNDGKECPSVHISSKDKAFGISQYDSAAKWRFARKQQTGFAEYREIIATIWRTSPAILRSAAKGIFLLAIISIGVFSMGMKLSLLDAMYFVVTTLTTTGYGDISVLKHSDWLKVYSIILMILGSASVAIMYSMVTDFVLGTRFDRLIGRSRTRETDHIVIVGVGNLGFRLVESLLRRGERVVCVDHDINAEYRDLLPRDLPFIVGDGRDLDTLSRANIAEAKSVVCATQNDSVNLSVALAARQVSPQIRCVVRIFDEAFADKVERSLDIDVAMSASRVAAPEFVAHALFPDAMFGAECSQGLLIVRPASDHGAAGLETIKVTGEAPPEILVGLKRFTS